MRLQDSRAGAGNASRALKPVDAAAGDGAGRPAPDQRARHLMELAMLAAALPLLVLPEGRGAFGNTKIATGPELAPEPAQGAEPVRGHGPLPDDADAVVLLAAITESLGAGKARVAADEMPAENADAFLALFAADMAMPSTLDQLWTGQGAVQPVGIGANGSGPGVGGHLVIHGEEVVYGAADEAPLSVEEIVAALEESFWELVGELATDFPEILAVIEPLMLGAGEAALSAPNLVVDLGGAASAAGDAAIATGDVEGALYAADHLMIATGQAQFTAQSAALDGAFAGADAMTWLDVAGADIVLTQGFEFEEREPGSAFSTSGMEFFALDYAGWAPENGTIYIDVAEHGETAGGAAGPIGPLQIAAVTSKAAAFAPNSDAETTSQAITIENAFSSVNAHAVFAGTA